MRIPEKYILEDWKMFLEDFLIGCTFEELDKEMQYFCVEEFFKSYRADWEQGDWTQETLDTCLSIVA